MLIFFSIKDIFFNIPIFTWLRCSSFHLTSKHSFLARDARFLKEWAQNSACKDSGGKFVPGHPVYGEEKPSGDFVAEGALTKGQGSPENPSLPLLPDPIDNNLPKGTPQNHIPFGRHSKIIIPPGGTHGPLPGSQQKLEDPKIDSDNDI